MTKRNKSRRGLLLVLAMLVAVLCLGTTALAADTVTLYTGGGTIISGMWNMAGSSGVYQGSGKLPAPSLSGAQLEGWYTDKALTQGRAVAGDVATGTAYYAKWIRSNAGGSTNQKMGFSYTSLGGNSWGIKNGVHLSAFFANTGFIVGYSTSVPAPGGSADYTGTTITGFGTDYNSSDIFTATTVPGVYVARLMSLEGGFVRLTLLTQNRGEAAVSGFNLGAAGDAQLGSNDFVPLRQGTDEYGSYLAMQDITADDELRLYMGGGAVTPVDRLWWGAYQPRNNNNKRGYIANTFNDSKDLGYQEGIDSAFAFSWKNIALQPGETATRSVLLGVGAASGGFAPGSTVTYNANGGTGAPTDTARYAYGTAAAIVAGVPVRTEYIFDGWSTTSGSTADVLRAGEHFPVSGNITLYAMWKPAPHSVSLTVQEAGMPRTGLDVALHHINGYGPTYRLTEVGGGRYSSDAVPMSKDGYQIYIDVSATDFTLTIPSSGTVEKTLDYGAVDINLTKDGAFIPGRRITLKKNNIIHYVFTSKDDKYTAGFVNTGDYELVISGQSYGNLKVSATERTVKSVGTVTYRAVLTRDSGIWGDAVVALVDDSGAEHPATLTDGAYQALLPSGDYRLMVNHAAIPGVTLTAGAPRVSLQFYTVSFYNGSKGYGSDTPQRTQCVQSGTYATSPPNPEGEGGTKVFKGWKTEDGGSAPFDFTGAVKAPVKLYASWDTPTVATGGHTRLSNTTYRLTEPKITGYDADYKLTSIQVTVTNGTVAMNGWDAKNGRVTGDKSAKLTIILAPSMSISDAEAALKNNLIFTTSGAATQRVDITVRASRIT